MQSVTPVQATVHWASASLQSQHLVVEQRSPHGPAETEVAARAISASRRTAVVVVVVKRIEL
jgi:hypothetical protein